MLQLREATPADIPAIHTLIGELADYERLRDQMVGNADDLRRHLFGEQRFASALLALWDQSAVGFALYFYNYSTFLCRPGLYIEDLFVRPAYRRRGIGQALLHRLEGHARELGCGRMEWSVLDWNESAIALYRRFGAHPNEGWTVFRKELA